MDVSQTSVVAHPYNTNHVVFGRVLRVENGFKVQYWVTFSLCFGIRRSQGPSKFATKRVALVLEGYMPRRFLIPYFENLRNIPVIEVLNETMARVFTTFRMILPPDGITRHQEKTEDKKKLSGTEFHLNYLFLSTSL
jgi:hypothetical protein